MVNINEAVEVADNIERIQAFLIDQSIYLSTSQQIMVGLALCRPELLAKARYPASDIKQAWARLDEAQRDAIATWWKSQGK